MSAPAKKPREDRPAKQRRNWVELYFQMAPVTVPIYAVLTAAVVGSVAVLAVGQNPITAYGALFDGAFGSLSAVTTTMARSTPYIFASLAVAFGFKAGLFNIGAEGQLLMGALWATWIGSTPALADAPAAVYIPIVLLAGVIGGFLWGFIPGWLKARTGAHEVIVTIMLNTIALRSLEWIVTSSNPVILLEPDASVPRSRSLADAARLPDLIPGTALDWGFVLALLGCVAVWFVLNRTTLGFEVTTVGTNQHAARYAGMSVPRLIVLVMAGAGALAGIGGAAEISGGSTGYLTPGLLTNIGFDSIAIALLARANPFAIIPAALLWGGLLSGAATMQVRAGLSLDLVFIIQGLIILFVAADAIVRFLFRVRKARDAGEESAFATGWGN